MENVINLNMCRAPRD